MTQQTRKDPEHDKTPRGRAGSNATKKLEADGVESSTSSIEDHAPSSLGVVHVVADGGASGVAAQSTAAPLRVELQTHKCNAQRYRSEDFPRCTACISKLTGETCRFKSLRFLLRAPTGSRKIVGFSFGESQAHASPTLDMPDKWNTDLQLTHIERVKRTVAAALLPVLKEELAHLQLPEVIRRPREIEVRATCDACMTSIFSSSWMCRTCGREACFDCFAQIQEAAGSSEPIESQAVTTPQPERHHRSPFFLPCTRGNWHQPKLFSPVTRFCGTELSQAIEDMEALLALSVVDSNPTEDRMHNIGFPPSPTSLPAESATSERTAPILPSSTPEPAHLAAHIPTPSSSGTEPSIGGLTLSVDVEAIPSHDTTTFSHVELTEELFCQVWSSGDPLVVTGVLEKFRVQWTPEYFCDNYGDQRCTIVECQSEIMKEVTVSKFFSWFGNYENRRRSNWKLKDWPPSADFKTMFPDLYDEFIRVTPMPNYVRRDGVLNIASHFPSNTIGPDLGPKMYNAQASFESAGSQGSTRLHLDMADAINIMTYASPRADGRPGCAAWDIFKVADTAKLRAFLHSKFAGLYYGDPIHAQKFYLNATLRAELYREHGVVSHRIYQKPGEVVFIPAGCAHQVCNLADCIKVACDFVSPENVERCGVLTREFREQNQLKAWKEDVLQLRTMMWFAWLSCVAQEKRLRELEAKARDDTVIPAPTPVLASAEPASAPPSESASVPPAAPSQTPAPAPADHSPSTHSELAAAPSTPTAASDEAASIFTFVHREPHTQPHSPVSTLPEALLVAPTSTTKPSNEDGSGPPAAVQALSPELSGARSEHEHAANPLETPTLGMPSAPESSGIFVLGAFTGITDILVPPSTTENAVFHGTATMQPSAASATPSDDIPMVVDGTNTAPNDIAEVSVAPKRASPEADLDLGPPTKRHKAEVGADSVPVAA